MCVRVSIPVCMLMRWRVGVRARWPAGVLLCKVVFESLRVFFVFLIRDSKKGREPLVLGISHVCAQATCFQHMGPTHCPPGSGPARGGAGRRGLGGGRAGGGGGATGGGRAEPTVGWRVLS